MYGQLIRLPTCNALFQIVRANGGHETVNGEITTKTDSQHSCELAGPVRLLTAFRAVSFVNVHCVISDARQRDTSEEDCHHRHVHYEAARIGGRD